MKSRIGLEALELAVYGVGSGIWDWDLVADNHVWSDQFYSLLGYKPNEINADFEFLVNAICHPEDGRVFEEAATTQRENHTPSDLYLRLKTKENGYRYFRCTATTKFLDGKPVRRVGTINDIHEKLASKEALLRNEHLLNEAGRLSKVGAWELDLETRERRWSSQMFSILELEDYSTFDFESIINFCGPWAREIVKKTIIDATSTGTSWDIEVPLVSAKGNEVWVRSIGKVQVTDGKPTKLYGVLQDLTESRLLEEKISVIFRHSGDAHMLLGENGIIDSNQAALDLLDYKDKSELLFMQLDALSPEEQPDGSSSAGKCQEMIATAYQQGYHRFEWTYKRKNGGNVPVEVTMKRVTFDNKEVLLVVWHDQTAKQLADERLRRNEAMLSETQQLTHSGSWETNLVTGESFWSDETFRILGLSPSVDTLTEKGFLEIVHPDDLEICRSSFLAVTQQGRVATFDSRIVLSNGTTKYVHVISKPFFDARGKVVKLYGAIVDIDERKKNEQLLIKAKEQADAASTAKSHFLSTMSHEIRTPMNAVVGFTNVLLANNPEPHQMEYLNLLKYSGQNLLVLINDILDYNKIEAGKIEFEKIDFNLATLMQNIHQGILRTAQQKGLHVKLNVDQELDTFVLGDPVRLGQVLNNLASNAVKFTESGSVTMSATLVKQGYDKKTVEFKVEDTGIGIPEGKLSTIFDQFTQASSNTTRKYGGSGLGLAIARKLLQLQQSEIYVNSREGHGAVFSFTLDFVSGHRQPSASPATNKSKASIKGIRVLLAEDNPTNVILMKHHLKQWEVSYDVAENGRIAFEMVQRKDYDVVLMDLQMPEMDGYEATSKIRSLEDEKYKVLPIIAVTASATLEAKDTALAVGMNDYISKPFNPTHVLEKIASILERTSSGLLRS